jgi:broad specificity phosphatase PhoE
MNHKIILIRHAESLANVNLDVHRTVPDHEIPLSELGVKQAGALDIKSLNLGNYEKLEIYTSPYRRAIETMEIALTGFPSRIAIREPLIAERRIKYRWGTDHYQKIIDEWKIYGSFWWEGFDHGFENGFDVYQRANIFLNKINHKHFSGNENTAIMVFTHGFFMQMLRCALIGDEGIDFNDQRRNPDNTEQWIFESHDGKEWDLTEERKNTNVEIRNNEIPV